MHTSIHSFRIKWESFRSKQLLLFQPPKSKVCFTEKAVLSWNIIRFNNPRMVLSWQKNLWESHTKQPRLSDTLPIFILLCTAELTGVQRSNSIPKIQQLQFHIRVLFTYALNHSRDLKTWAKQNYTLFKTKPPEGLVSVTYRLTTSFNRQQVLCTCIPPWPQNWFYNQSSNTVIQSTASGLVFKITRSYVKNETNRKQKATWILIKLQHL